MIYMLAQKGKMNTEAHKLMNKELKAFLKRQGSNEQMWPNLTKHLSFVNHEKMKRFLEALPL